MKHKTRKALALLLALTMSLGLMSPCAWAAEVEEVEPEESVAEVEAEVPAEVEASSDAEDTVEAETSVENGDAAVPEESSEGEDVTEAEAPADEEQSTESDTPAVEEETTEAEEPTEAEVPIGFDDAGTELTEETVEEAVTEEAMLAASNLEICGVDIGIAPGTHMQFTDANGNNSESGYYYKSKYLAASQCFGFARWCQYKLFGSHSGTSSGDFKKISVDGVSDIPRGELTVAKLKQLIQAAKPGAHLRTHPAAGATYGHSMIITAITDKGFSIAQCNGSNNNEYTGYKQNYVGTYTYTWAGYVSSTYGQRGIDYIEMPNDYPITPSVNLGDDFYAYILNAETWRHVTPDLKGTNVAISAGDDSNKIWHFQRLENGSYKITCVDGRCMEVYNFESANGTNVILNDYNGNTAQRWVITGETNAFIFRAECGSNVLDLNGGNPADGTNIQMWESNGSYAQKFAIYPVDPYVREKGAVMTSGYDRTIPDGDYMIVTAATTDKSGFYYLDIEGSAVPAASGTNVSLCGALYGSVAPNSYDIWTVTYHDGFYSIFQRGTSVSLDVSDADVYEGANIQSCQSNSSDAQKWAISCNWRNGYRIQAKCSGLSLDIAGGSITDGTNVRQWRNNDTDAQSWLFIPYQPAQPIDNGRYMLLSAMDDSLELDVAGDTGDIAVNTNVQIWRDFAPSKYNSFDFTKLDNGYYRIIHAASGMALEVSDGTPNMGSNVAVHWDNGTVAQQWAITKCGEYYYLRARCSGYALDVKDSGTDNGTNVLQYPFNSINAQPNQLWKLVRAEYAVTYNANGGNNAPESQTKYYKENINLSTEAPTRSDAVFKGWNTKADGTGTPYAAGAVYEADADITLYAQWEMSKINIANADITGLTNKTYTGSPITQTPTVKVNGNTLANGTDYTLNWSNNTNAGTATVTVTGKGNYTGSATKTFTITPASLANAEITGITDKTHTCSPITQTPTVKVNGRSLTNGTDYTLSWSNNTNVGTATMTVTGKGNYTGTATKTFQITQPAVVDADAIFQIGNAEGLPGAEITVPVSLTKNTGIAGFTLDVQYDHNLLTFTGATAESGMGSNFTTNGDLINWYANDNVTLTGKVFNLSFTVKAGAATGTTTVSLAMHSGIPNVVNEDFQNVSTEFRSGTVSIITYVLGDVTGDQLATIADVVKINRHVIGRIQMTGTDLLAADVTGDGLVTIADVVKINRFVIGRITYLTGEPKRALAGSAPRNAATGVVVTVGEVNAAPGETVDIPVSISGNTGVAGMAFDFTLPQGVTLNSIGAGAVLSAGTFTPYGTAVTWYALDNVATDGVLMTLNVTVPNQAGDYTIGIALKDGYQSNFSDENGTTVPVSFESGTLKVKSATCEHSWDEWQVTTEATCTADGEKTFTCSKCRTTRTEVIPAKGHSYKSVVTAPTCTERGYTTHTCERCNDSYQDTYTNALGHSWNNGVVTKPATVSEEGVKTFTCGRCGATRTEEIPKLEPIVLAAGNVTLAKSSVVYNGKAQQPAVTVKYGGKTLVKGTDYTVSCSSNTNVGTAKVTVTGKGSYTGSVTKKFTITKAAQTVTATAPASVLTGKTVTVTAKGTGTLTYTSSNAKIATVTSKGVVKGIAPGTVTITVKAAGNANYNAGSATVKITVKLPTPAVSKVENVDGGVKITVGKVTGAAMYRYFYKTGTGKWTKLADTEATAYTWKSAKSGTSYDFTVRCISKDGKTYTSDYNTTGKSILCLAVPTLANSAAKTLKVTWKSVSGVTGYQVAYATSSGFSGAKTVTVKSAKTLTTTIKDLKKGTTYYVRFRTYTTKSGKTTYSDWSGAKSIKITK